MPLRNYRLLKGKASDLALDDDASPHIEIRVEAAGSSHRIAVNVRSNVAPHDLLYRKQDPFDHPMLERLLEIPEGMTDLRDGPAEVALDYVRGGFVRREAMEIAPFQRVGPRNDLREFIEPSVTAGILDPSITFYAFGETWGPEPAEDPYFHFVPGSGIHNIHMNQGSSGGYAGTNGPHQDGALLVHFGSEGRWVAIFLAFQSQSWDTDEAGDSRTPPPVPATQIEPLAPGIAIVAALIDPQGREEGRESVTILNRTDAVVDLSGWRLRDHDDREMPLGGIIEAGKARRFILEERPDYPRLRNKGGAIILVASDGTVADAVKYEKNEAAREGWTTLLR
ncbi:DUF2278 family protein [Consotaella aegiceratis]|uniref:DUF2278 family protein n=1 Tax=Consotaella aegiceratis TaxID=3097961 RepID=UPI002F40677E